jgi:hypothetical protein
MKKTGEKSHKKRGKESEVMMKLNAWHAERRHQQAPQYLVYPINEKKTKLTRRAHIPLILRHYRTGPWRRDLPSLPTTGRLQNQTSILSSAYGIVSLFSFTFFQHSL